MRSNQQSQIADALFEILVPLTKICIRQNVSNSEFEEIMRLSYVVAAQSHNHESELKATNSHIGLLTGLSRKEVSRLKSILADPDATYNQASRIQMIIDGWLSDKEFLASNKTPLSLPINNTVNGVEKKSFKALVERYGRDLYYQPVLHKLEINKVVKRTDDKTITLQKHHINPPSKSDTKLIKALAASISSLTNEALDEMETRTK